MENSLPKIVQKAPFKVAVEAGKKYFWCSCGLSQNQPFCDGSHKGSGLKSVMFEATESKILNFCGCKHSKNGALCDGAHNQI
ncbi:MAG: CDGSH iron-sulfur domain-containing protein [Pseudomonadota bacterium]